MSTINLSIDSINTLLQRANFTFATNLHKEFVDLQYNSNVDFKAVNNNDTDYLYHLITTLQYRTTKNIIDDVTVKLFLDLEREIALTNATIVIDPNFITLTPTTIVSPPSTAYIFNQSIGPQTADFWISGNGRLDGTLIVNGISSLNGGSTSLTRPLNDSTLNLATTAFVQNALNASAITFSNGFTNNAGVVQLGNAPLIQNTALNLNGFTFGFSGDIMVNGLKLGRGNGSLSSNTAFGNQALVMNNNSSGLENTAIGQFALTANTSGRKNTGIGAQALSTNTVGEFNTGVGDYALISQTTASYNTAVGSSSLYSTTIGGTNTAIGTQAGYFTTTGIGNVFLGYSAGYNETGSNKLYIANSSTSTPLLQGDFSAATLIINGIVSITGNLNANTSVYTPLLSNIATQDNAKIQLAGAGLYLSRNIGDANPIVIINNEHASSTGKLLDVRNQNTTSFSVSHGGLINIGTFATGVAGTDTIVVNHGGQLGTIAALSLTTTGTGGAATLTGSVLNIPNYAGGVTSVFTRTGAIVAVSGDYNTSQVTESGSLYFTNARAIASTLTGYVSGSGTLTASDTILSAIQKLNGNIAASVTGVASVFGRSGTVVATSGDYNTLQVTENTNLYFTNARATASTLTGYTSGAGVVSSTDTILSAVQKLNGNIAALVTGVSSFNTRTGAVTLTTADVNAINATTLGTIGTGVWQGTAIADTYISSSANWNTTYTNRITSLTTTGNSGAATLASNVLNIPNYTLVGLGGISSISLVTPGVLYTTPVTWSVASGAATATLSLITQSANGILAGPTTGSAAAPTFRALVSADIPSNVALAGSPTTTTQATADNTTKIATTAFVQSVISSNAVYLSSSVFAGAGTAGSPYTIATAGVTNAMLANSTISGVSLGGTLAALSQGTGITSFSYTGASTATVAINQGFAPTWTGVHNFNQTINVTPADSVLLINPTAAALNAQQFSPGLNLGGFGWATTGSTSQASNFRIYNSISQGTGSPTGSLTIDYSVNGGAYSNKYSFTSSGAITQVFGSLAASQADALFIRNTTASTVGTPVQRAGSIRWQGAAWNTTTPANNNHYGYIDFRPVSGATPSAALWFSTNITGSIVDQMSINSAGNLTLTGGLVGVTSGSNASASIVGEIITSSVAVGSAVTLTTATAANVTSISLTAGDWDVTGVVAYNPGVTTTTTYFQGGISTTTATIGALGTYFTNTFAIATNTTDAAEVCPTVQINVSGTTTVYLVTQAAFAVSTLKAYGFIRARRIR